MPQDFRSPPPAEGITVVAACSEHYAAVAEVYNESIRRGQASMEETLKTEADIAAWVAAFHAREGLYVLLRQSQVLGWGLIKRYSDREGYRYTCETATYLRLSEVGRGYGTYLKRFLLHRCRALDYHHVVAKVLTTNPASIAYNRKLGYQDVGLQKEVGYRNGQWLDVLIMQLRL